MLRAWLTWRRGLAVLALALGGLAAGLWFTPSGEYILLPDRARLVEPLVQVPNEDGQAGEGEQAAASENGGIYMVDIFVRRANLLERLFPSLNRGATLVPARAFNPEGVSEEQRQKSSNLDMTHSQQIAAAVALEALGYRVDAEPNGAEISLVLPGSPAAAAGFEPGDVIVRANGKPVETLADLSGRMEGVEPGGSVSLTIRRSGGLTEHVVQTTAAEDDPGRAVIGVRVVQAADIELPFSITIDAGSIGGPSAGLAFALDIVDELGTEVDHGRRVVVTGALDLDGSVTGIGGIKQKTIGARETGADVFVVPEANAEEAQKYADGLEIVSVATFSEALEDLGAETSVS